MQRRSRIDLAFTVVLLVFLIAALAIPIPSAFPIFERLLPALMLVLGFYFGQKS